jgi:hypothetical protein
MRLDRNNDNNTIATINWNDVIKQDTRSIDDVDLGKVKRLFEPFIVTERGTISKEKFYIPKSLIEKYDAGVLYFGITEQEAKDTYMRESPPSEDEIKHIETITEKRVMGSRKNMEIVEQQGEAGEGEEQRQRPKTEEKKIMVVKKTKELKEKLAATTTSISTPEIDEEEIIKRVKQAANELKDIILSGTKVAREKIKEGKDITQKKIKEQQEAAEERKAEKDAENISKMGDLAVQFSSSFDEIVSEISSTRTYAEQEQIYKGFIKLLEQQLELLVARKDLAARLKNSVQQEPIALNNKIKQRQLTEGKKQQQQNKQLPKASELLIPEPQLPEIISTAATTEEEKIKSKPQIKTAAKKELRSEEIADRESLSPSSSSSDTTITSTTTPESPSTEVPSAEISSTKREGKATAIDKRKLAKEKKKDKKKNR